MSKEEDERRKKYYEELKKMMLSKGFITNAPYTNVGKYIYDDLYKMVTQGITGTQVLTTDVSAFTQHTPPTHVNCPCIWLPQPVPERTEINKLGSKAAAACLLSDTVTKKMVVPSKEEWIGVNLLDLDGELPKVVQ